VADPVNLYNEILYNTFPRQQTHPDRLAAVGTLIGMKPTPITNCRVLEIGCGDGNNLIPMAYSLPDSEFVGVDLADGPIATGRDTITALGLTNISLHIGDLRDIGGTFGQFDYIVAHGVYSWVPDDVRDGLMAICRELLTPQGIAFISYNAYPGCYVRQMMSEMMSYHTRKISEPRARVEAAREFLSYLTEGNTLSANWQAILEAEAKAVAARPEDAILHDDLEPNSRPIYFRAFVEHAAKYDLQFLGEAEPHTMFDLGDRVGTLSNDVLEREQYLDFLRARRFRQTLLCRKGVALEYAPPPEIMESFLFSSPAKRLDDGQVQGLHGVCLTDAHQAVYRVVSALGEVYPLPLAFEDLLPYSGDREGLSKMLLGLVVAGFCNIHIFDFPCEESATEKPRASRLARYQASKSKFVTNACHLVVELDEVARHAVVLMDGTRDHEAIATELAAMTEGVTISQIREALPSSLEWLAGRALLEG
jgi:methyltransferase-like protein/trans-aconitate methyltransferase